MTLIIHLFIICFSFSFSLFSSSYYLGDWQIKTYSPNISLFYVCLFNKKNKHLTLIYISNNRWYVKYLLNLNPLCNSISTNSGLFAVKAIVITSCHPVSWIMINLPNTNSLSVKQKEMLSQTLNMTREKVFTTSSKMSYFFACLEIFKYFVVKKFKSDN